MELSWIMHSESAPDNQNEFAIKLIGKHNSVVADTHEGLFTRVEVVDLVDVLDDASKPAVVKAYLEGFHNGTARRADTLYLFVLQPMTASLESGEDGSLVLCLTVDTTDQSFDAADLVEFAYQITEEYGILVRVSDIAIESCYTPDYLRSLNADQVPHI